MNSYQKINTMILPLKRQPGMFLIIMQISDIGALPEANAGADRCQGDVAVALIIDAQTSNKIKRPFNAREAFINFFAVLEAINQHESF